MSPCKNFEFSRENSRLGTSPPMMKSVWSHLKSTSGDRLSYLIPETKFQKPDFRNMAENFETVKISIFLNVTQIGLKTVFSQLTLVSYYTGCIKKN